MKTANIAEAKAHFSALLAENVGMLDLSPILLSPILLSPILRASPWCSSAPARKYWNGNGGVPGCRRCLGLRGEVWGWPGFVDIGGRIIGSLDPAARCMILSPDVGMLESV
jgi:hypothetical protein